MTDHAPTGTGSDQEPIQPEPTAPEPAADAPAVAWERPGVSPRVPALAAWFAANRAAYTDEALERSAISGGYTPDEVAAARAYATERETMRPVKTRARIIIVAAYVVVWLLFAFVYLWRTPPESSGLTAGWGAGLQQILTISLLIGLGISALAVHAINPDPRRTGRALVILLVVPVITLLGIAGLCLPFVRSA